jgi:GDPmannose 4,6-dehydratase
MRKPGHVSKLIAQAALRHSRGDRSMLELGDIEVEKEWAFAGDVTEGIFKLVGQDREFEATIGTGEVHSIRDWVEACYGCFGLDWRRHVRTREGFVPEYRRLVSDPTTIRSLGWSPTVGLSDLARMMTRDARPGSPVEG